MYLNLLTRDGRIPKNKWIVIRYSGGPILSRHKHKSSAMDAALTRASKTGDVFAVGEIGTDKFGKPGIFEVYDTKNAFYASGR